MLLLLQSYCPSLPCHHIITPLPARCTPLPSPPSHTAISLPPSPHTPHCCTPRICSIVTHLIATHATSPPSCSCMPHVAAPLTPAWPHCHPPHTCTHYIT